MAVAVVALAQLVDVQGRVDTASNAQRSVNDEAHDHTDDDLGADDLEDDVERHLLGQENGQHLVRRGKEHGEQRSQRDDAPRPQRRGGGRKPALRHGTHDGAHDRARSACALNGRLSAPARLVFQPFHGQIRDEQERDDVERVGHGVSEDVARYVHEFFHSWLLYPNRRTQGRIRCSMVRMNAKPNTLTQKSLL